MALTMSAMANDPDDLFHLVEVQDKSEVWINPGMASYHFDQNKNYNGANWGAGLEYRFNTVASVTAGRFYNSDRQYSNYCRCLLWTHCNRPHQTGGSDWGL